jgi:glycerophosphoryl diester phosphodiesterase
LLSDIFQLTANTDQLLYVEMKCEQAEAGQLVVAVVQLIADHGNSEQVVVESFDLNAISAVKKLNHDVRTAALFEPRLDRPTSLIRKMRTVQQAIDVGANELALHHSLAAPRVVEKATASGLRVVVWTVDKPAWVQRARRTGIHALITNNPALLLRSSSTDFSL